MIPIFIGSVSPFRKNLVCLGLGLKFKKMDTRSATLNL